MNAAKTGNTRVGYLLKRYPRLSETFILHEMLALERRGVELSVYSMMDPGEKIVHPDVHRLNARVNYLPQPSFATVRVFARAHITLMRRAPRRYLRALGLAWSRADRLAGIRHFIRAGWLGVELERLGIRHLHAHFAHGPAATAHFTHLLTGISFSFTGHAKDIYTTRPERIAERMRDADFIVTCTGHNVEYLSRLVDANTAARIHRIYHGVDLERFQPEPLETANLPAAPVILAVGRLVEKKGLMYLVEACQQLRERDMTFTCRIVGSGPMREALQERIDALGIADIVTLDGPRTQEALVELYRQASVMALPCVILENGDRDGIPNVLVEAMSMALPVVSTTVSGIPELVTDGVDGLLVPPRDAAALTEALAALLIDGAMRERLGAEAHRTVTTNFDLAHNVARLEALYTQSLGSASEVIEAGLPNVAPVGQANS